MLDIVIGKKKKQSYYPPLESVLGQGDFYPVCDYSQLASQSFTQATDLQKYLCNVHHAKLLDENYSHPTMFQVATKTVAFERRNFISRPKIITEEGFQKLPLYEMQLDVRKVNK